MLAPTCHLERGPRLQGTEEQPSGTQWTLWVEEMGPEFTETKLVRDHLQNDKEETPVQRETSKVFRGLPMTAQLRINQGMHVEICRSQRKSHPKDEMYHPCWSDKARKSAHPHGPGDKISKPIREGEDSDSGGFLRGGK